MAVSHTDLGGLEERAGQVAGMLSALANDKRLMILCELVERRECTVGALAKAVALSQSALSQHLAKMRDEGIVTYRRDAQTLWYRLADGRVERLLGVLHELYCRPRKKN